MWRITILIMAFFVRSKFRTVHHCFLYVQDPGTMEPEVPGAPGLVARTLQLALVFLTAFLTFYTLWINKRKVSRAGSRGESRTGFPGVDWRV